METVNYNPDVLSCLANLSNDEVFTPPTIVNQMLDLLPQDLFRSLSTTFLDPVCKTGVFLREIAKRLNDGLKEQIPDEQERINHIFTKQLFGIAITELTSLVARRSVYCSKTADGKYSVCSAFDTPQGHIIFHNMQHTWINGRCKYCGASQSVYDRDASLETHAYQFIHTEHPKAIFKDMNFDVIIGNPPYQLSDGGNGASAKPIYQYFVEQAKKLRPHYVVMIIPSRWFAGGKGLDKFRENMMNDDQVRYIKDFVNAKDCFPNNSIGGGICYFLWERDTHGSCNFVNSLKNKEDLLVRHLNEFPIFVRYNRAINIIHKVKKVSTNNISEIVLSRNPFGLPSFMRGNKTPFKNCCSLISSQGVGYISKNEVSLNKEYVDVYKVMVSKVTCEHAGEPDRNGQVKILSSLKVIEPGELCTDSYLIMGFFQNKSLAINLCKYLQSKFARFLLLQAVTSINLSKDKFQFVPLQDFSESWTDEKLYKKYNLTKDEIAFIESMIRPME